MFTTTFSVPSDIRYAATRRAAASGVATPEWTCAALRAGLVQEGAYDEPVGFFAQARDRYSVARELAEADGREVVGSIESLGMGPIRHLPDRAPSPRCSVCERLIGHARRAIVGSGVRTCSDQCAEGGGAARRIGGSQADLACELPPLDLLLISVAAILAGQTVEAWQASVIEAAVRPGSAGFGRARH